MRTPQLQSFWLLFQLWKPETPSLADVLLVKKVSAERGQIGRHQE